MKKEISIWEKLNLALNIFAEIPSDTIESNKISFEDLKIKINEKLHSKNIKEIDFSECSFIQETLLNDEYISREGFNYRITVKGSSFISLGSYTFQNLEKIKLFELQIHQKKMDEYMLYLTIILAISTFGLLMWDILKWCFEHCH